MSFSEEHALTHSLTEQSQTQTFPFLKKQQRLKSAEILTTCHLTHLHDNWANTPSTDEDWLRAELQQQVISVKTALRGKKSHQSPPVKPDASCLSTARWTTKDTLILHKQSEPQPRSQRLTSYCVMFGVLTPGPFCSNCFTAAHFSGCVE